MGMALRVYECQAALIRGPGLLQVVEQGHPGGVPHEPGGEVADRSEREADHASTRRYPRTRARVHPDPAISYVPPMPGPVTMDKVVALCKRRGLIFPASEIYGGIANTYDYGHYGVLLKNNVVNAWWRAMIQERDDVVALDSAIIQHPRTWDASGHLSGFSDPLVQCLGKCKQRFREDHLREDAEARGEDPDAELRCPVCGGELSEPRQFNLMFETHVGPVADSAST